MAVLGKLAALATLAGLSYGVDNTQPTGTNPIQGFKVDFLGNQTSDNSCVHRDLGFAGQVSGNWYAVYGDNIYCAPGVTNPADDPNDGKFHGQVRDSVSTLGSDPLTVHDLNLNSDSPVAHPYQFVPYDSDWGEDNLTGFGGTSIVQVNATQGSGAVYYLVNLNSNGLKCAGVAETELFFGTIMVKQRYGDQGCWWDGDTQAHYGDIAAYQDEQGNYTYILGHPPNSISGFGPGNYAYQARVLSDQAFDLSQYEYWWGREQGWKSDILTDFTTETAVMWNQGQGQIVWSSYFSCYIFVHLTGNTVQLSTAPSPEGPWSANVQVYQDAPLAPKAEVYAGVAYPYLDTTGKTLTVAWTNDNTIRVAKVTFD